MSRPLIGITTWRRTLATDRQYSTDLDTNAFAYQQAVAECGGTPILIPHVNPDLADQYLDLIDGLLVSGGDDVDPGCYGGHPQDTYRHDASRDAHEIALVLGAKERKIPTFGICRGLQIAAVALGGTLVQDIAHTPIHPGKIGEEELTWRHDVTIDPESRTGQIVGAKAVVNSLHHQAIDNPGELTITARTVDGVNEGAEYRGGWWFTGVQWHPERLYLEHDQPSIDRKSVV